MKRSLSAPCLADGEENGSKKAKEESEEPTGREYLQLALARVLELQRQVKDETYTSDNTSDLGESDSEEDVMKEVLIKVFKDLPGSSPAVTSIINRATRPQPPQIRAIRDKRIQLSGYDTCRKVALEFMNTVVKSTPVTEEDFERFEMGTFSRIETKMADHKTGLTGNRGADKNGGENSNGRLPSNSVINGFRNYVKPGQLFSADTVPKSARFFNGNNKRLGNYSGQYPLPRFADGPSSSGEPANNLNQRSIDGNRRDNSQGMQRPSRGSLNFVDAERNPIISRDYEIRVRMLKGLDLHLATKQRDFTARLMRQ
ncbi:uncharacterized protein LOC105688917 [Athalia rosae]|uniref:uncharacterized protein LOC105688917 n=1 Tax=Athalia rosae TaxID=37344 RepID=UPI002033B3FE|nr:uncharacterized protein LOC105688917 [Athalia rosae]